jgi:hypothetical protein
LDENHHHKGSDQFEGPNVMTTYSRINAVGPHFMVSPVTVNGGGLDFEISESDVPLYSADPDTFVAKRLGFTDAAEYQEWLPLQGAPLCGGTTRGP